MNTMKRAWFVALLATVLCGAVAAGDWDETLPWKFEGDTERTAESVTSGILESDFDSFGIMISASDITDLDTHAPGMTIIFR